MIIALANIYRNNLLESSHYGHAVVYGKSGLIKHWGEPETLAFTRSIIKPIQAKIAKDILGSELDGELLAIAISSHNAIEDQLTVVNKLMQKFSITEKDLQCGCNKKYPNESIKHNCSGKHSALIAACKKQNWDHSNYLNADHPIQKAIIEEVKRLLGKGQDLKAGTDGCGLQTFQLSLQEMASIFHQLINDPSYKEVIESMNKHPLLIGGPKQIDSILMATHPGKFIAKGGAEGMVMIANLESSEALVIKISDGSHRAKAVTSIKLLEDLGWIEQDSITIDNAIYNAHQEKVGEIKAISN